MLSYTSGVIEVGYARLRAVRHGCSLLPADAITLLSYSLNKEFSSDAESCSAQHSLCAMWEEMLRTSTTVGSCGSLSSLWSCCRSSSTVAVDSEEVCIFQRLKVGCFCLAIKKYCNYSKIFTQSHVEVSQGYKNKKPYRYGRYRLAMYSPVGSYYWYR